MARLGSIAAAPFLGDQFVSLYLGAVRVPTVPGKPVINDAYYSGDLDVTLAFATPDGGSSILYYSVYRDGNAVSVLDILGDQTTLTDDDTSIQSEDVIQIAAVNAIGEGPLSHPVMVLDA